ncbi:MAG: signal peptidase I [Lachnospiraceae bacterium]|nr:signal peptidase I [Lachnospiraceae bacterium]
MSRKKKNLEMPTVEELEKELHREKYRKNFRKTLRSTIYLLITVAAASVLVATLFLPVLQIYGTSMTPTLTDGDIVVSLKSSEFVQGDIVAFYYNNKILVKRVIATEGEWVSMDEDGNVYVDGTLLDEPYVSELAYGECDITFPYQVPEGKLFVLGDHRSVSVDSRSSAVGCVSEEQIVGKLTFRVWPITSFGKLE